MSNDPTTPESSKPLAQHDLEELYELLAQVIEESVEVIQEIEALAAPWLSEKDRAKISRKKIALGRCLEERATAAKGIVIPFLPPYEHREGQ